MMGQDEKRSRDGKGNGWKEWEGKEIDSEGEGKRGEEVMRSDG